MKCFRGRRGGEIHIISSISEMLSQMWGHCFQFSKCHPMSPSSLNLHDVSNFRYLIHEVVSSIRSGRLTTASIIMRTQTRDIPMEITFCMIYLLPSTCMVYYFDVRVVKVRDWYK